MKTVAIIGASQKEDRYSNMAQRLLVEHGYEVVPVAKVDSILGERCYGDLAEFEGDIDTVTLYIGSARVDTVLDSILAKKPRRVIFNPGTENAAMRARLEASGIETIEGCTLVMLRTGQF